MLIYPSDLNTECKFQVIYCIHDLVFVYISNQLTNCPAPCISHSSEAHNPSDCQKFSRIL
jgi:hypothetical protein